MSRLVLDICDGYVLVTVGDAFAQLGRDEALWEVACWLQGRRQYLKTYEQHNAWPWSGVQPVAGLLTYQPQAVAP